MTRRLWLCRHGETAGQSSIRYHGSNDVPLSDLGRAQIAALAPVLRGLSPARIVCSPLSRARESAAILTAACAFAPVVEVDDRLREISFGACEGLTAEEISARFPEFWARHRQGLVDAFPGGESRRAFRERVAAAARELALGADEQDVLIVAHRGTVRASLLALLPGVVDGPRLSVQLGSVSVARRTTAWELELLDFVPDDAPR